MDGGACHPPPRLDAKKKTLAATERDEAAREQYRARVKGRKVDDFVVVDECGTNLDLTPRYARAPRGQRAHGAVPRNTPPATTLIAALTTAGMGPALTLAGAADRAVFEGYVEHVLAPSLRPGQVVVLDNLAAHKGGRVQELIAACGCELWYVPAYSPDLSPIEPAFAKLKELLRRAEARVAEALERAIAAALDSVAAHEAEAFFTHCGYGTEAQ